MSDVDLGRRPLLVMAVGWLSVVVAVAAITFLVVDRAGRGVGEASAAETVAVLPTHPPRVPNPSPTPSGAGGGTASFTTDGGIVVASCEGSEISSDSIRPRDGWRFETETEEGGLEVVFRTSGQRVDLILTCERGVPTRVGPE